MNPLFNRIMIACDLSKMDEKLMKCAGNLARNTSIQKIYLVHVISNQRSKLRQGIPIKSDGIYPLDEKVRFNLAEMGRRQIDTWSIDVETIVLKGHVYNQLIDFTKANQIDLVVLGKKNRKGGTGEMAKRLARNVSSSVLFLTPAKSGELNSVLVPVDFSNNSAKALQTAIRYKKNMELPIRIKGLHITKELQPNTDLSLIEQLALQKEQLTKTEQSYQKFLIENNIDVDDLEPVIVSDEGKDISETICSDIMNEHSKLVIMGAKGQSAIEKYFYGSVTERLVDKHSDIPVLVVR